jgi:exodeoxyribonuclease V alpha subunit
VSGPVDGLDPFDVRRARGTTGLLGQFNRAGVLSAADIHVARRIGGLAGADDDTALLGAALAVRAPRLGHVCVDLATIATTASSEMEEADLSGLAWPEVGPWVGGLAASPLVGPDRPLRLEGTTLYLDRYWAEERQVARDLVDLADQPAPGIDLEVLATGIDRLFGPAERAGRPEPGGGRPPPGGGPPDLQRLAAASAVLRRVAVIAGGPGTGKTTTVARLLALVDDQAAAQGRRPPLVALAAPTGKAAARLQEAVHEAAGRLAVDDAERARLLDLRGVTLHRLLGFNPGNRSRFRHHRLNRLAHDVVVVDETSMVSLSLMARLVEAVRPEARLVLVGDPEQLASVEAGAVLGDIVGPAAQGPMLRAPARRTLAQVTGSVVPDPPPGLPAPDRPIGDGVVVLRRVYRFGGAIAGLAEAVRTGRADEALDRLAADDGTVTWIDRDVAADGLSAGLEPVRGAAVANGRALVEAARAGQAATALEALGGFRLLCAHRHGPAGATTWRATVEGWLDAEVGGLADGGPWYAGRPLLVTENDYGLRLFNGDTGVVVAAPGDRVVAAFERGGEVVEVSPTRLAAVDTVYAMTVHKAQGSQFDTVAVVLPGPESPILTRELLYTAITRARHALLLVGTEASVRAAVGRPIARASGLRRALWGDGR